MLARLLLLALVTSSQLCRAEDSKYGGGGKEPWAEDLDSDVRDLFGGSQRDDGPASPGKEAKKRIPRLIHQTYKTADVPSDVRPYVDSWRKHNPGWKYTLYDDNGCLEFVKREFPEYLKAYKGLPKNVERADFFRYMVILRLGGVYADLDVECKVPLDDLIRPTDTLIVSYEQDLSTADEARRLGYTRMRQVLQWAFAGAPGHPALRELCDRIASAVRQGTGLNSSRATLERTGPAVWTDVVLEYARLYPPARNDDPSSVRVMPRLAFGASGRGYGAVYEDSPGVVAAHHFLGSWKPKRRKPRSMLASAGMETAPPFERAARQLYPVSTRWEPPFTMLVHLQGQGDLQAGKDVAAEISAWGFWQPALKPYQGPSIADVLVKSLSNQDGQKQVLVDIGAGVGFFSLAAAARGHQAIAFELAPASLESLRASIAYNGFQKLVTVHEVALGHEQQEICLDTEENANNGEIWRGYGYPEAHAALDSCKRLGQRLRADQLIGPHVNVGAVRISASGWEGWVLDGLKELLAERAPRVVLIELYPRALEETEYAGGALRLLQEVHALGYTHVGHSGRACEERWNGFKDKEGLQQPTWCRLLPESFEELLQHAAADGPENIIFAKAGPKSHRNKPKNRSAARAELALKLRATLRPS